MRGGVSIHYHSRFDAISLADIIFQYAFQGVDQHFFLSNIYIGILINRDHHGLFAFDSLFAFGLLTFITLGLASVATIRKNNSKINKISLSGPVSTSA